MSSNPAEIVEKDQAFSHQEEISQETREIVALNSIEDTETSRVVWIIAVLVSVGGFLFGMETSLYPGRRIIF
jgi:hypothetical protein